MLLHYLYSCTWGGNEITQEDKPREFSHFHIYHISTLMTHFPVSSSILSPRQLALFVRENYALSTHTTCHLLKTGISHSYLITDGETKFVFRVYSLNWRSKQEINEEIRLLQLLKENSISVSYAIADKQGEYIQELPAPEGTRYGLLFSFAKGRKEMNFSAEKHFKVGQLMGRMHVLTQDLELKRIVYTPQVLLEDAFKRLKTFLPVDAAEMVFMAAAKDHLLQEYKNAGINKIRTGTVHMDIWFDNMHFDAADQITIFDFDFCGNGWLLYDIAYYLLQIKSTEKIEEEHLLKRESFFRGYESVTKISDEEKRLLPVAGTSMYFFYLGIQCQRFEDWSNVFLNEIYLKRFINILVRGWYDYHGLKA